MIHRDIESRSRTLAPKYDVIVVGGGIYGATLTWEIASRGLSVILLEKADFGAGTSANSLKIIHGGIRYLQSLNLGRVLESVRERKILMHIAPHLVRPLECVVPTYKGLARGRASFQAALALYKVLAAGRNIGVDRSKHILRRQTLSRTELRSILPHLYDSRVTGGAHWYDAQAYNTERLVLAFVMSAKRVGAQVFNHMQVREVLNDGRQVQGVVAEDQLTRRTLEILGDAVIDCTGAWAQSGCTYNGPLLPERTAPVLAMNVVVCRSIASYAVGFRPQSRSAEHSNRFLFVTPWRNGSVIGTWYYSASDSQGQLQVPDNAIDCGLEDINGVFSGLNLSHEEVVFVHLGLLPAANVTGSSRQPEPSSKPQVIHAKDVGGPARFFWVQGVKYTTARSVAVRALDLVVGNLGRSVNPSISAITPLYGGEIQDFAAYEQQHMRRYAGLFQKTALQRLLNNYGTNVERIFAYVERDRRLGDAVPGTSDAIKAELHFVIDNEMPYTLSDLMLRRTDLGTFAMPASDTIDFCAELMATRWGWDNDTKEMNIKTLLARYPTCSQTSCDREKRSWVVS